MCIYITPKEEVCVRALAPLQVQAGAQGAGPFITKALPIQGRMAFNVGTEDA